MKKLLAAFSMFAAVAAVAAASSGRPARITSATTYYDRKEGIIYFDKDVYVVFIMSIVESCYLLITTFRKSCIST